MTLTFETTLTFEIQTRFLGGVNWILSMSVYDRHPDVGGIEIDGGYYSGIGSALRDCGFKPSWTGSDVRHRIQDAIAVILEDHPVYLFGNAVPQVESTDVFPWSNRRFPPEFYEFRPPDAFDRFLKHALPPYANPDCPRTEISED